jgi:hypothetical protein
MASYIEQSESFASACIFSPLQYKPIDGFRLLAFPICPLDGKEVDIFVNAVAISTCVERNMQVLLLQIIAKMDALLSFKYFRVPQSAQASAVMTKRWRMAGLAVSGQCVQVHRISIITKRGKQQLWCEDANLIQ